MNELNESILHHSGGVDANNLKSILDDFDIAKEQSHEHLFTSSYYEFEGTVKILSDQKNQIDSF